MFYLFTTIVMYKEWQALLVSNIKKNITWIDIKNQDFNGCKIKYFLYTTPAGYVCVDSYDTYRRIVIDKESMQDEEFSISIRKYANVAPEWYIEIEWDIYAIKDVEDNCEIFDISNHVYIEWKRYKKEDIIDSCDEIEVIAVWDKQYDIQDIADNCDAV